jgi:hypothetical protein
LAAVRRAPSSSWSSRARRALAGALGDHRLEGHVLAFEQGGQARPQGGLALLYAEQRDDQPEGAQGQPGDGVLHLAEALDRLVDQRLVARLEVVAQHLDRLADLVHVGLAGAALARRPGADHAAGGDRVGEQGELQADQPGQGLELRAVGAARRIVGLDARQQRLDGALALGVGVEIDRLVVVEEVAANAGLGVEHHRQQGVEAVDLGFVNLGVAHRQLPELGVQAAETEQRQHQGAPQGDQQEGQQPARAQPGELFAERGGLEAHGRRRAAGGRRGPAQCARFAAPAVIPCRAGR